MIKNGFGRCGTHSPVSDGEGRPGEKMSDRVLGGSWQGRCSGPGISGRTPGIEVAVAEMGLGEWRLDKPSVGEASVEETGWGKPLWKGQGPLNEWSSGSI